MAQSKFRKRRKDAITKYTYSLVSAFFNEDEEDERSFDERVRTSISKLNNHKYMEIHPRQVDSMIQG